MEIIPFSSIKVVTAASRIKMSNAPRPYLVPDEVIRENCHDVYKCVPQFDNDLLFTGYLPIIKKIAKLVLIEKSK